MAILDTHGAAANADLEPLVTGGFASLGGFMSHVKCDAVCTSMRLPSDQL
jgi:ATP sulfurylase